MLSTIIKRDKAVVQQYSSFNTSPNSIRRRQRLPLISDVDAINQLDVADGLKQLLIICGFTLELLQSMSSNDLAGILGIDKYVARIIVNSVINNKKPLE